MPRKRTKHSGGSFDSALQGFILWKRAQGVSKRTLDDYVQYVALLRHHFQGELGDPGLKVAVLDLLTQDVAPATHNLRLQNLSGFFAWCAQEGHLGSNPCAGLRKQRTEARKVSLGTDELKRLLSMPDKRTYVGLRDYVLILLTMDTGIRPSEALSLMCTDCSLRAMEVHVRADNAKTRVGRTLPIAPMTARAIGQLMAARPESWGADAPLLCSVDGTRLTRWAWSDRMEAYSARLGTKIRPYDLRHAFALEFLRGGGNVFALQRTLGHSDLSMTKRYVALTQQDLREHHLTASPVNRLLRKERARGTRNTSSVVR